MKQWYEDIPKAHIQAVMRKHSPQDLDGLSFLYNIVGGLPRLEYTAPKLYKSIMLDLYEIHPHRGGPL